MWRICQFHCQQAFYTKSKEKHGLSVDELKQIPYALYNPVIIFDPSDRSTNFQNGMVILTQIHDSNGNHVVIALNIEKRMSSHKINDIASIYGKDNAYQIIEWIKDGFLRYSHRNRARAFARFHRLSLPKNATISARSNHTIIDESPDVKLQAETLQFKKFFNGCNVVDQNGEPLVVYHGSSADFYAFDPKKIKSGAFGKGIYLSPSKANTRA